MKLAIIASFLLIGLIGIITGEEACYDNINQHCSASGDDEPLKHCTAQFSSVHTVKDDLAKLVRIHLSHSYQYLLMSTNFANYEKNREGFAKMYRKLSDRTWEDAVDLVKYLAKRGIQMDFREITAEANVQGTQKPFVDFHELESLSRALDLSKHLATEVHKVHGEVTKKNEKHHDPDVINYLEEKFVEKHTKTIRDLAGHTNDLTKLVKDSVEPSLAIFLFDEHLKSIY